MMAAGVVSSYLPVSAVAGAIEKKTVDKDPVQCFSLSDVQLLDGPFRTAQELDEHYLLSLDVDRLLHNFRVNAGLKPKAPVYGGWESQEPWIDIRCHGHTLGHYLSACSMMLASTGNEQLRRRVDYIVSELALCQRVSASGMVCAFPDGTAQLENSLSGKPFVGVPWYTTHKVLAGLRDAHLHAHNRQAVTVMRRMADWIISHASSLDDVQFQTMLRVEHGGMNEVLANLHEITGEEKYLHLAQRFSDLALLQPLSSERDTLDGLHSNTQIPKVIGFQRLYKLTGNREYGTAASFFWNTVIHQRSFATGGNGDGEHFFPVNDFAGHLSSAKTMETCCTHNMLRLTRALFMNAPQSTYVEYYERALFNGILASQDPVSGMMTYFQATRPGYVKLYCTPENSFWCCTGSGIENHAKYGDSIYFHDDTSLYVNLFIASKLNWREKKFRITQETTFPEQARSHFSVRVPKPTRVSLKIRHPSWCQHMTLTLNGHLHLTSDQPGSYVEIDRIWRDGDVIEANFPMQLRMEPLPHNDSLAAIMFGPIVLAARLGSEDIAPGADIIVNERKSGEMLNVKMDIPSLPFKSDEVSNHVLRASSETLTFNLKAQNPDRQLELIPFYRIAHERYNLYWQLA